MPSSSVSVQDLSVTYGAHKVLDRLSLEIPRGEFLVLLGSSGCGKSTLLNAIAGLQEIADGRIHISGQDVTWAEPKDRGIGMVFQSYALYPRMTVRKNMSFGLKIRKLPAAEIDVRVDRAARLLHIEHLLDRRPSDLSGGQRQRVAIGRALVRDVDVFLFDEPLSNLDAQLRAELRVELKKLHNDMGNTMIYVTHDQVEAMTLADRIAIMKDGIIQQLAPPSEIYNRPANMFVAGFIGAPKMNFLKGTISSTGEQRLFEWSKRSFQVTDSSVANGPVILGVRPENIRLDDGGASGGPTFGARVLLTEELGAETIVWVDAEGEQISLRTTPEKSPTIGQAVTLALDIAKASFFDPETGRRVEKAKTAADAA